MWTLTRSVRINVDLDPLPSTPSAIPNKFRSKSGFSGSGPIDGLPSHYEFQILCRGPLDPLTSYVRDIKEIDRSVVQAVQPALHRQRALSAEARQAPTQLLAAFAAEINQALGGTVTAVRWWVTPYHSYEMTPAPASLASSQFPAGGAADPGSVVIRQRFDFSASHRLHNPAMTDAQNKARFGKCNNAAGHGHNYVVEPCVRVGLDRAGLPAFTHADLQEVCSATLIDRFDHKHLNVDTAEFADAPPAPGLTPGVLPTVENIAKVFFDLLAPAITARAAGASLVSLTVWETDRTSSTYPG